MTNMLLAERASPWFSFEGCRGKLSSACATGRHDAYAAASKCHDELKDQLLPLPKTTGTAQYERVSLLIRYRSSIDQAADHSSHRKKCAGPLSLTWDIRDQDETRHIDGHGRYDGRVRAVGATGRGVRFRPQVSDHLLWTTSFAGDGLYLSVERLFE